MICHSRIDSPAPASVWAVMLTLCSISWVGADPATQADSVKAVSSADTLVSRATSDTLSNTPPSQADSSVLDTLAQPEQEPGPESEPDSVASPEAVVSDTSTVPIDSAATGLSQPPQRRGFSDEVVEELETGETLEPAEEISVESKEASEPTTDEPVAASTGPELDSGDIVIEVDQARSRNEGKSLGIALGLSALLPGSGELYLQDRGRAKSFYLFEVGFWASLFVGQSLQVRYLQSARNYASNYAGIDASRKDEDFLNEMATYRSYREKQNRQDSYETSQILSGKRSPDDYDLSPTPENDWDFGSSVIPENTRRWNEYRSTLRHYRGTKIFVSFAIGALALNRLASMVNTLHLYRTTSQSRLSWQVVPQFNLEQRGLVTLVSF